MIQTAFDDKSSPIEKFAIQKLRFFFKILLSWKNGQVTPISPIITNSVIQGRLTAKQNVSFTPIRMQIQRNTYGSSAIETLRHFYASQERKRTRRGCRNMCVFFYNLLRGNLLAFTFVRRVVSWNICWPGKPRKLSLIRYKKNASWYLFPAGLHACKILRANISKVKNSIKRALSTPWLQSQV